MMCPRASQEEQLGWASWFQWAEDLLGREKTILGNASRGLQKRSVQGMGGVGSGSPAEETGCALA